ncbi:unnamed protein product [Symbiodinium sp. CCMP2456]|nr:unnamed protein product [Symbiodinium sp. CCMP2456]
MVSAEDVSRRGSALNDETFDHGVAEASAGSCGGKRRKEAAETLCETAGGEDQPVEDGGASERNSEARLCSRMAIATAIERLMIQANFISGAERDVDPADHRDWDQWASWYGCRPYNKFVVMWLLARVH